ncbi:MAG TPA: PAC2 family protein [Acidimicrobiales bacterium]|nr:PAC2 family protein [Acidimicrobiales bacterium]
MALYERHAGGEFVAPALVMCLEGWVDAGLGGTAAMAALLGQTESDAVATFDGDSLIDRRARRPIVRITEGVHDGLTWPAIQLRAGKDAQGSDVLFLVGPEPDFMWGAFTRDVIELSVALDVRIVVGLGAFPAPVPHTRPIRLAATASSPELASQVGFVSGTIDVPAGIQAVLEQAHAEAGIPALGLWARVPHYAAAMPYPAASAALVDALALVAGLSFSSDELAAAAVITSQRVDQLIASSDDHKQMVRQLEEQIDVAEPQPDLRNLPSGDELAAELERFLRDQG